MKVKQLKDEIADLPVDQRIELADYILETLNRPDPEIEKAWIKEVQHRKKQVETGKVKLIPGEQVMEELKRIAEE